ncbi:glycosyltransferase family 4 protein [Flavobacterium lipolyticum]|uniref:Glycosyltransferase family 4 protein n=1 Tax=Flavobacterium lipolyticum TaxID=2893754 RepID=A0ABS8LX93_9FLAO|nr:glycosyltransferase family 4 protein [Flavobacterium sp. F-126]MCC9017158.1 glycosyltransferase family 4 protein [Flavobacterium sp. F-126]
MKIAFILPSLINTGPIVVVHNIVNYLKDKVDLIDVYYLDDESSILNFECNTFKIDKRNPVKFNDYDIIHSHTLRADLYVYKWRKKISRAKIVSTIHQDTFKSFAMEYNNFVSFFLTHYWCFIQRKFDGVVSISNQIKDRYNKLLSNKLTTIYNGCSIDNINTDEEIEKLINGYKEKGYKVLGSYAYITKRKGLSQVVKALEQLPDYVFVLIGEGPYLAKIKENVEKLNLSERVLFLPYMQAPYSYLKFFDVYMMPSYSEGFGLAMVEAALAQKSIVCSNLPSFKEIFNSEEVCFFELDNLSSLQESIQIAYLERNERGERANSKAVMSFTAEKMAENHLSYYKKILKN